MSNWKGISARYGLWTRTRGTMMVVVNANLTAAASATTATTNSFKKERQEWEIEPSKLIIKSVIARGTFGTVHRGIMMATMSPFLNGNLYNRKCNVYGFGICLWEIYCRNMPYPDHSFSEVTSAVVRQNLRPEIPGCCPSSLGNVMKRCWDAEPDKRPEMDEVVSMLEAIDTSKGGGIIPPDLQDGCLCFRLHCGP